MKHEPSAEAHAHAEGCEAIPAKSVHDKKCNVGSGVSHNSTVWEFSHSEAATSVGDYFLSWSSSQVAEWVKCVQAGRFAHLAEKFQRFQVDGIALSSLSMDKLLAFGVRDPRERGMLLAAISVQSTFEGGIAVDPKAELARDARKQQLEAHEEVDDQDPRDAAAAVLRSMFSVSGTTEMFVGLISDWRARHLASKHEVKDENLKTVCSGGAPPSITGRVTSGIVVAARVRPILEEIDSAALEVGDFEAVSVPADSELGVIAHICSMCIRGTTPKIDHKAFPLHVGFGPACNDGKIFDEVVAPLSKVAVEHSTHTTVICYGQTGSGKTHTVGHFARHLASYLFDSMGARMVALEAFEITGAGRGMGGNFAYSLTQDDRAELLLVEGSDGVVHVGGSSGVCGANGSLDLDRCELATRPDELVIAFKAAEMRRASQDTGRNKASSRSHAFYRFHLAIPLPNGRGALGTNSCVELVDLAGSESNKDSMYHNRQRVEDTAKINSSLMALNDCIRKQAQGAAYIPFRADKLTQLLRPCFVKRDTSLKDAVTVLFLLCLSPLASDSRQSVRGLTYAQQLTGMKMRTSKQATAKARHRPARGHAEWIDVESTGVSEGTS